MKRLLLWIAILTICLSSGIALTGQAGIGAPKPAFAQWFTYPDGKPCPMPCLFGIRPGVTTMKDAESLLRNQPNIVLGEVDDDNLTANILIDNKPVSYMQIYENGSSIVPEIQISQSDTYAEKPYFLLKDVLLVFGVPSEISLSGFTSTDDFNFSLYKYTQPIAFEVYDLENNRIIGEYSCRIGLTLPVYSIHLFAKDTYKTDLEKNYFFKARRFYHWAGFSRHTYWNRYFQYEPEIWGSREYECIE